jgi:hypothetical protein
MYQKWANQPPQEDIRKRYTPKQIQMYFEPYRDRGPAIHALQQKIHQLEQIKHELQQKIAALKIQRTVWRIGAGILTVLFLLSLVPRSFAVAFVLLAGAIGCIFYVTSQIQPKIPQLEGNLLQNDALLASAVQAYNYEVAKDAEEKADTARIQPPDELQYDQWINELQKYFHDNAPKKMHLPQHQDFIDWDTSKVKVTDKPGEYGASLPIEGIIDPDEDVEPSVLKRNTQKDVSRQTHQSAYVFTSLFITEDYVAIYTATVNLRDATMDKEEFEYCYHQHLSHLSLKVVTIWGSVDAISQQRSSYQIHLLSLIFDSGFAIKRSIETLRYRGVSHSPVDEIHKKLTIGVKDHTMSLIGSLVKGLG